MRPIRFLAKSSVAPILKSIGLAIVLCSASAQIAWTKDTKGAAYREAEAATAKAKAIAEFLQFPIFLEETNMRDARSALEALGLERTRRDKIENSPYTQDWEEWEGQLKHPRFGEIFVRAAVAKLFATVFQFLDYTTRLPLFNVLE